MWMSRDFWVPNFLVNDLSSVIHPRLDHPQLPLPAAIFAPERMWSSIWEEVDLLNPPYAVVLLPAHSNVRGRRFRSVEFRPEPNHYSLRWKAMVHSCIIPLYWDYEVLD